MRVAIIRRQQSGPLGELPWVVGDPLVAHRPRSRRRPRHDATITVAIAIAGRRSNASRAMAVAGGAQEKSEATERQRAPSLDG